MNLKQLKETIDQAVENSEDGGCDPSECEVEVWVGEDVCYEVSNIGQFSVKPDITIHLKDTPKIDWRK